MSRRGAVQLVLLAVLGTLACDPGSGEPVRQAEQTAADPDASSPEVGAAESVDPPVPAPRPPTQACRHDGLRPDEQITIDAPDPLELAVALATTTHRCAPLVVLAPTGSWAATLAVPVALDVDAPLLLVDLDDPERTARVVDQLGELGAHHVISVGFDPSTIGTRGTAIVADGDRGGTGGGDGHGPGEAGDPALRLSDDVELALAVAHHLDVVRFVAVPEDDRRGRTAAASRVDDGTALLPVPDEPALRALLAVRLPATARVQVVPGPAAALADDLLALGIDAAVSGDERWPDGDDTTWLTDPEHPDIGAVTAVTAAARQEPLLPVDTTDLRSGAANVARVRAANAERVVVVGDLTRHVDWQLRLVRQGSTLPGGALRQFEGERVVALYGSPRYAGLGALGEQDLDATVERLREATTGYDADGSRVTGAFEIIATIASTRPGEAGDYSDRTDVDLLRPYVDRAAVEGFQVIIDLQPGRSDFLTQAREYEELLLEPHVGLALDAEWRIGPDELPLQRIGSVEVDEVQQVAQWLAELTRDNDLPQKLFVLHQFTDGMLPDRDDLDAPPELAVVIHMDGQGGLRAKRDTFAAITDGAEDRWVWGWKNFYDEDSPVASAEQVLDLEPVPMFVTYQ